MSLKLPTICGATGSTAEARFVGWLWDALHRTADPYLPPDPFRRTTSWLPRDGPDREPDNEEATLPSPIGWLSWERIVRARDATQGSDEAIKAFRNTILGETWHETAEARDWQRLYDRRERRTSGAVPASGCS